MMICYLRSVYFYFLFFLGLSFCFLFLRSFIFNYSYMFIFLDSSSGGSPVRNVNQILYRTCLRDVCFLSLFCPFVDLSNLFSFFQFKRIKALKRKMILPLLAKVLGLFFNLFLDSIVIYFFVMFSFLICLMLVLLQSSSLSFGHSSFCFCFFLFVCYLLSSVLISSFSL